MVLAVSLSILAKNLSALLEMLNSHACVHDITDEKLYAQGCCKKSVRVQVSCIGHVTHASKLPLQCR